MSHPKLTPKRREAFLACLRESPNVTVACAAVNINRTTAYKLKKEDDAFRAEWEEAVEAGTDAMEAEARRRAVEGCQKAVYYEGKVVGYEQVFSDTLMIFLLKAHRPEKYNVPAKLHHGGADGEPLRVTLGWPGAPELPSPEASDEREPDAR